MAVKMRSFYVAEEVRKLGVQVSTFTVNGLTNRVNDPGFSAYRDACLAEILSTLSKDSLRNNPVLAGFRQLHSEIGVSNKKYVAAPEALLSMLMQTGRLPQVNLLVDIYNLISVQTRLSLGAHDLAHVTGDIHLRLTTGSERFYPLGASEPKAIRGGEYAYIDGANDVLCRLEVRQAEKTKITVDTRECFYIVQGNPNTSPSQIHATVEQLISLTKQYCGGSSHILTSLE